MIYRHLPKIPRLADVLHWNLQRLINVVLNQKKTDLFHYLYGHILLVKLIVDKEYERL